ncbi:hypothetical protein BJV82DRAFT_643161 [Fennellomyces sp. T-0311]|nr:hypothetical protein BJV82DRAFT_643161 [Fennellomyces sp. T-0311]
MVSLWWGQSALDELIEKATNENQPAGQEDVALQFMISDQIRSKKVNAKDAMRSLKRRLEHKNPNVQMFTLSLTDTCVKNGGDQFVREIASREFMEAFSTLVHSPNIGNNIKFKALSILQTWALAAKNTPSLSYLTDTYNLFRAEGIRFPTFVEPVNSFLLETIAPPEWTDSDVCERCRTAFTLTNRKHHCRNCGGTFCQECSSKTLPLPHMAIDEAVRVCYGCYIKLKLSRVAKKEGPLPPYPGAPQQQVTSSPARASTSASQPSQPEQSQDDKQFEEDLKKALELSKKEAGHAYGSGYVATDAKTAISEPTPSSGPEEDDPELAAAIAASLKDMEDAQKSTLEYYSSQKASTRHSSDELTPVEMENIELFSLLMHRINDTRGSIANDDQINRLYTQIGTLQPKLAKNLDEASQKHKKFAELHEKLNMSVRTYDQLLQQRVANSYTRPSLSSGTQNYYSNSTYPTSNITTSPVQQQPAALYPTMQQPTSNGAPYAQQAQYQNNTPNAPPTSYQYQPEQPYQSHASLGNPNYGSPAPAHQQPIQSPPPPSTYNSQPQYHYESQPYPQQQAVYPTVPTHTPPPQQQQQQPKPVEEANLIDL